MSERKSIWEWALSYVGDPESFHERGQLCLDFLRDEGLHPGSRVLDIGCGALSQGIPLIHWLDAGCYVGVDPNGWLIEAALEQHPELEAKNPRFSYAGDFDTQSFGPFDFVIAHSVLSHVAHWQLTQALLNTRAAVNDGAIWLASYRGEQRDALARTWQYPGVSLYRFETIRVFGFHAGWDVQQLPDHRTRMVKVAPNDYHDWIKLTATLSDLERNRLRIDEEARRNEDDEILEIARVEWQARRDAEAAGLQREMDA